jgi:hypothetical protein
MGGAAGPILCKLDPSIQESSTFNTDGVVQSQAPGEDLLTVSFDFQPIQLNDSQLYCKTNELMASYPFNPGKWAPNESGLEGLQVPMSSNAGSIPISHDQIYLG